MILLAVQLITLLVQVVVVAFLRRSAKASSAINAALGSRRDLALEQQRAIDAHGRHLAAIDQLLEIRTAP